MLQVCPHRDELSSLVLGTLPLQDIERVAAHLERCPACRETIYRLDSSHDTLLSAMIHRQEQSSCEREPALSQALEKVSSIGIPAKAPSSGHESQSTMPSSIRDYQLRGPLGQGGMGTVFKALHTQLEKMVAIKVLSVENLDSVGVARFKREIKAVGKLHHPNIVQAFDAGEHDSHHYLVMELIDGMDLSEVVETGGPLPVADACELIRQAAVALEYVRQQGMVHRDVKPSNLMLNSAGQLKLLDLGLALLHDPARQSDQLTALGSTLGTADYVAPEQSGDSHHVDIRADIYSLGCTMFKLLTGRAPFPKPKYKTSLQKMMAHRDEPFPDITTQRSEVRGELKAVLERMVAKEPSQRFTTPADVAAALEPFCQGHNLPKIASSNMKS